MRKRILALALALCLCAALLPSGAAAAGDIVLDGGYRITADGVLIVPERPSDLPEEEEYSINMNYIPEKYWELVTGIKLPDGPKGITTSSGIDGHIFPNLKSLTIPSSMKYLYSVDFDKLESVVIEGSSELSVGGFGHGNCPALRSVVVKNGKIGNYAFSECTALESLTIGEGVTSIGSYAFQDCDSLVGVVIPSSVTEIGGSAFVNCSSLRSVTILPGAESVSIGANAFYGCKNLLSITIPPSVKSVGLDAIRKTTTVYGEPDSYIARYAEVTPVRPKKFEFVAGADPNALVGTAYTSTQTVLVDGKQVTFYAYALLNENGDPTNYVKLRDVAAVLNGTAAQFEVGYDGSVLIEDGKSYTSNGSENIANFYGNQAYKNNSGAVKIGGSLTDLEAITLTDADGGDYNYFQLRDLGKKLGFNVGWSYDKGIFIETDKPYDPNN